MQKEKSKNQTATGDASVACPFCGSTKTRRETDFGTTLAYAQFYCLACRTPFEWIKWEDKISERDLPTFLFPEKNVEGLTPRLGRNADEPQPKKLTPTDE